MCLDKYSYHDSGPKEGNGHCISQILTKSPLDTVTISVYFSFFFTLHKVSTFATIAQ